MIDPLSLKKRANWIFAIAWMILIFGFSGQTAKISAALSGGIVNMMAKCIQPVIGVFGRESQTIDLNMLSFLIRKAAHAFLYFVLAILVCWAISPENEIGIKEFLIALGITFLYACSDECHQLFLDGRSGEFRDVMIDTCGGLAGLLIFRFLFCGPWRQKKRNH